MYIYTLIRNTYKGCLEYNVSLGRKVYNYPLLWYSRATITATLPIERSEKMAKKTHLLITLIILMLTTVGSGLWFMNPPIVTKGETEAIDTPLVLEQHGKYVVIYLNSMSIELRVGSTTLATLPILSQGKPGSYYETIGGAYMNDYKTPLHFSSIGHVYMPYSVHLFGNYFIHGIPYYPNGTLVSSAYSGGCIRLANEDAEQVYNFVDKGTLIVVTQGRDLDFLPTQKSVNTLESIDMTNLMVAAISLEVLTQDNPILDTDGVTRTTRRNILPRLLRDGDSRVAKLYARSIGEETFIDTMNTKAQSLGLSSTHFNDVTSPVTTTDEDYARFMTYISTYKSYLRTTALAIPK